MPDVHRKYCLQLVPGLLALLTLPEDEDNPPQMVEMFAEAHWLHWQWECHQTNGAH